QTFNDNVINNFCLNKKVHNIKSEFFSQNNKTFWSVAITYDEILKPKEKPKEELTETQKKLYQKLREWRAGRAEKDVILLMNNGGLLLMNSNISKWLRFSQPR
ncbi:MAG: hypothetical protein JXR68_12580, partial [Bacteroidales bacterium]|nr:hypothetical protein [Bacteroidales bacterium]